MLERPLRRREFLRRGGELALATSAASLVSLDQLAGEALAGPPLRKCISLGGFVHSDNHPDDYRFWGNREFIRDESRTTWVKLWVSWHSLQEHLTDSPPTSYEDSWAHLNTAPTGQAWLRYLDRQVKAIKDDGLGCLLTLDHAFPTWANGATGNDPVSLTKEANRKLPLDLTPSGPWAWFISHLLARYRKGMPVNAIGPHEPGPGEHWTAQFGNPDGAWIDALEICNEPNHVSWPQEGVHVPVARMIRTAEQLSHTWAGTPIVAPGTSDYPDDANITNSRGIISTTWAPFTRGVLAELRGFRPRVPVRWSHHNYRETRFGEAPSRTGRVLWLLDRMARWRLERQPLWLTEGGLNMSSGWQDPIDRDNQASQIEVSFHDTKRVPEVFMWTQHTVSDKQWNSFKGGLRDDFTWEQGARRGATILVRVA